MIAVDVCWSVIHISVGFLLGLTKMKTNKVNLKKKHLRNWPTFGTRYIIWILLNKLSYISIKMTPVIYSRSW